MVAEDVEETVLPMPGAGKKETGPDCHIFPFGKGCMGFGLGPLISSDGQGLVYGAGARFTYFLFDRFGVGPTAGAIFGSGYQDYSVGTGATYFIGPFAGYLLTPSFGVTRHFLRGNYSMDGWAYGPSIGLMSNLFGRVYWGISVGYYTYSFPSAGYKSSDWSWSPVVFIPF
jgi:hypothetical protein